VRRLRLFKNCRATEEEEEEELTLGFRNKRIFRLSIVRLKFEIYFCKKLGFFFHGDENPSRVLLGCDIV
jgi:hypothetical protein